MYRHHPIHQQSPEDIENQQEQFHLQPNSLNTSFYESFSVPFSKLDRNHYTRTMLSPISEADSEYIDERELERDFEQLSLNMSDDGNQLGDQQRHSTPTEKARNQSSSSFSLGKDNGIPMFANRNLFGETQYLLDNSRTNQSRYARRSRLCIISLMGIFLILLTGAILFTLKYYCHLF